MTIHSYLSTTREAGEKRVIVNKNDLMDHGKTDSWLKTFDIKLSNYTDRN